jgi:hypothetical protein
MFVSPTLKYAVNFASLLIAIKNLLSRLLAPIISSAAENSTLAFDLFTPATKVQIIILAGK